MEKPKNFKLKDKEIILYTALFVDNISLLKEKYPPVHPNEFYHHSTITFRPEKGKSDLNIGRKNTLTIIGRITSDKIDALLVENEKSINNNPHITLSTAKGIKPFASNREIMKAINEGTIITIQDSLETTEGYFNGKTDVID